MGSGGGGGMGGGIGGAISGVVQGYEDRKRGKKANQQLHDMARYYTPAQINAQAALYNPALYGALAGQRGTSGYQNALYNIAQSPGYIDPRLMNASYTQSAQRQQSDLAAAQGMLGRSAIGGGTGLGSAYALANQSARTGRDVNLGQQYALWREQQRRADVDWLAQQQQQAQGMAFQGANAQTGFLSQQQQPRSWLGVIDKGWQGYTGGMAAGDIWDRKSKGGGGGFNPYGGAGTGDMPDYATNPSGGGFAGGWGGGG